MLWGEDSGNLSTELCYGVRIVATCLQSIMLWGEDSGNLSTELCYGVRIVATCLQNYVMG